jgi:hypothetical protein
MSADQGRPEAQNRLGQLSLGELYNKNSGVPQNCAETVRLFRWAARQGDPLGQGNLAYTYKIGCGVRQDNVLAHMWYNLAGATGASYRDEIAQKMTPQQIAEAQKMARECKQRNFKDCD